MYLIIDDASYIFCWGQIEVYSINTTLVQWFLFKNCLLLLLM